MSCTVKCHYRSEIENLVCVVNFKCALYIAVQGITSTVGFMVLYYSLGVDYILSWVNASTLQDWEECPENNEPPVVHTMYEPMSWRVSVWRRKLGVWLYFWMIRNTVLKLRWETVESKGNIHKSMANQFATVSMLLTVFLTYLSHTTASLLLYHV